MEVGTGAAGTVVGSLSGVEAFVELQVDELCKTGRTLLTLVRPLAGVEALVGLQVTSAAEPLVADLAFMWLLSCVNQVVFLQVGQLCEVLVAGLTPEGTLATVNSEMDLKIRQLSKDLSTNVALVPDLSILSGQRVGQCLVPHRLRSFFGFPEVHSVTGIALRG